MKISKLIIIALFFFQVNNVNAYYNIYGEELSNSSQIKEVIKEINENNFPYSGNKDGKVVIYEFFDYQCGYCKAYAKSLSQIIKKIKNIKIVHIDIPILYEISIFATRAAFLAQEHDKYNNFRNQAISYKGRLNEEIIIKILNEINIDTSNIKEKLNSPKINSKLKRNLEFAKKLDINGTPYSLIGKTEIKGYIDSNAIKKIIKLQ